MLIEADLSDLETALANLPAERGDILRPLAGRMIGADYSRRWLRRNEDVVPHRSLRQLIQSDAALEALLLVSPVTFTTDATLQDGFAIGPGALVRLSPRLLSEPLALSTAIRAAIDQFDAKDPLVESHMAESELSKPLEQLLVAGGDNRLAIDPVSGMNRYGTAPRPRPDAVQFSSSTASSISETAFWFCELVRAHWRRRWLAEPERDIEWRELLADAVQSELLALIGMEPSEADAVLCASGTDAELLAVMASLGAGDRPLTNILIAPEESGRGVLIAGEGKYFDDLTQTGHRVVKGGTVWPACVIEPELVTIRDPDGSDRSPQEIAKEVEARVKVALAKGHQVLVHQLLASKTGLSAPGFDTLLKVQALDADRVDIVIDTCQMRVSPKLLGDLTRHGWMLQISGSKAFTGPPFAAGQTHEGFWSHICIISCM